MKFLDNYRQEIIKLMTARGFSPNDFSYVKRKGRIFIQIEQQGIHFAYFRKKQTTLNPVTKQWEHSASFKIQVNRNPEIDVKTWSEVMMYLDEWLATIILQKD